MWQVLLGIYLVFIVLSAVVLWSALVMAKRSDRRTESRSQRGSQPTFDAVRNPRTKQIARLLKMNHLSEK